MSFCTPLWAHYESSTVLNTIRDLQFGRLAIPAEQHTSAVSILHFKAHSWPSLMPVGCYPVRQHVIAAGPLALDRAAGHDFPY